MVLKPNLVVCNFRYLVCLFLQGFSEAGSKTVNKTCIAFAVDRVPAAAQVGMHADDLRLEAFLVICSCLCVIDVCKVGT